MSPSSGSTMAWSPVVLPETRSQLRHQVPSGGSSCYSQLITGARSNPRPFPFSASIACFPLSLRLPALSLRLPALSLRSRLFPALPRDCLPSVAALPAGLAVAPFPSPSTAACLLCRPSLRTGPRPGYRSGFSRVLPAVFCGWPIGRHDLIYDSECCRPHVRGNVIAAGAAGPLRCHRSFEIYRKRLIKWIVDPHSRKA